MIFRAVEQLSIVSRRYSWHIYGHQLESSEERTKYFGNVENELRSFAQAGYANKDSDLRWRHVVLYEQGIGLVDLESLEGIGNFSEDEKHKRVEAQMERLRKRMGEVRPRIHSNMY